MIEDMSEDNIFNACIKVLILDFLPSLAEINPHCVLLSAKRSAKNVKYTSLDLTYLYFSSLAKQDKSTCCSENSGLNKVDPLVPAFTEEILGNSNVIFSTALLFDESTNIPYTAMSLGIV